MGHGANNKLYITHAEHSGALGQHSASSGHKKKVEGPHPGARIPFDCCAISLQPFSHPVCSRNPDGTGTVFDLTSIIPWLKNNDNKHPIYGTPLQSLSLITLHYARNSNGELHDPVTFKVFSEHSHIVAIATTGNVFLADSVRQFASAGRDLVSDVPFKNEDVISLQDPHNFGAPPPVSASSSSTTKATPAKSASASSTVTKTDTRSIPASKTSALKVAAQPYNISPYSTGHTGASLTSTAVAPRTETDVALFDEEELMYDEVSRVKKEKDRAKKRAYVRMVTSLGGSLNLELFCEKAPKTCYNFLMLARQGKYNACPFHRLIPGFMVQGGDPTGTGRGGESYWGTPFRDEYDLKGAEKHSERGMLSMANKGMNTNGSQFFITFRATPHLDGKHTVFGKLVGGEGILDAIEQLLVQPKTDRPLKPITVTEIAIYADPFEDYKQRLTRKLQANSLDAKSSALSLPSVSPKPEGGGSEKGQDDVNWFGVKLGSEPITESASGVGGVGKYLNLQTPPAPKRNEDTSSAPDEAPKKRRKLGFGNFENW